MPIEKILREFIGGHKLDKNDGISVVTFEDLAQLKAKGYSVEELLNHLVSHHNLLHGSRADIRDDYLNSNERGYVYSTNLAAIAIMKAIISNRGLQDPGLEYPYFVRKHPFELKIHGINSQTIGDRGVVYVVEHRGFRNEPRGSWQYRKNERARIKAKISVRRTDFTYPIFDVTNNRRIQ